MNKNTALLFLFAVPAFRCSHCILSLLFLFRRCDRFFFSVTVLASFFVAVLASFLSLLFSLYCHCVATRHCFRCFFLTVLASFFTLLSLFSLFIFDAF